MGIIQNILAWRDRRYAIIQLDHEITRLWDEFNRYVKEGDLKDRTEGFEALYSEYRSYVEIPEAERDRLQTRASIARARSWGVPLPPTPSDLYMSNEYWDWDRVHQARTLSTAGHRYIRHEVALERDIKYRPILSWAAIIISVCSLFFSFLKS